jgi:hypothetical protein
VTAAPTQTCGPVGIGPSGVTDPEPAPKAPGGVEGGEGGITTLERPSQTGFDSRAGLTHNQEPDMTQPRDSDPFPGTPPPTDTPAACADALDAAAAGCDQLAVAFGERTAVGPPANMDWQLRANGVLMRQAARLLRGIGVDPAHPGADVNGVTPPNPGDPDPRTGNVLVSPGPTQADIPAPPPAGQKRR